MFDKTDYERAVARMDAIPNKSASIGGRHYYSADDTPALGLWGVSLSSANAILESDRKVIMSRARDAVRNFPMAQAIVSSVAVNAVSTHLNFQPNVDAKLLGIDDEQATLLNQQIESA